MRGGGGGVGGGGGGSGVHPSVSRSLDGSVFGYTLLWIYYSGHAEVSGNERADRLASSTDITSGLQLGRADVLRGLRNFLNMDRPEHPSTDRLEERGVEKGSGRHFTFRGRERPVFNQTNICTVSRAAVGRLLRGGVERVWASLNQNILTPGRPAMVCLLVGCLTSQQQASVSQGRICSDNFTCCHTEIEVADPKFYLTQSQYTDTGPTSRADQSQR